MKASLISMVFVIFLLFVPFAFAQGGFDLVVLKEEDSNSEVALRVGDVLLVALKEVPSAGYKWEVLDFDRTKILFLQTEALRLSPPGVLGGTELRLFVFKAVSRGRTPLRIVYSRPWESFKGPLRAFYIEANIK